MKKVVATDRAPKAIGPYSQAIVYGGLAYLSGQIPLDPATGQLVEGDIAAQTTRVLENLKAVLEACGSGLDRVLKTTVYVASADKDDLYAVWQVVAAAFGDHDAPSTLLGVTTLGYTGQLVEIEAVALAGKRAPAARE